MVNLGLVGISQKPEGHLSQEAERTQRLQGPRPQILALESHLARLCISSVFSSEKLDPPVYGLGVSLRGRGLSLGSIPSPEKI